MFSKRGVWLRDPDVDSWIRDERGTGWHWALVGVAVLVLVCAARLLGLDAVLLLILMVGVVGLFVSDDATLALGWLCLLMPYSLIALGGGGLSSAAVAGIPLATAMSTGVCLLLGAKGLGLLTSWKTIPAGLNYMLVYAGLAVLSAALLGLESSVPDALTRAGSLLAPVGVGLYCAQLVVRVPKLGNRLCVAIILSMDIAVMMAFAGNWQQVSRGHLLATGGVLGHPASLGYYCASFLPLALLLGRESDSSELTRRVAQTSALIGVVGFVASGSRGALLALLAATVVVGLVRDRRLALGGLLAGSLVLVLPAFSDRIATIVQQVSEGSGEAGSGRLHIWAALWTVIREHPFLGTGFNSYFVRTQGLLGGTLAGSYAHNDYLFAWIEQGVAGPLLLLASSVSVVRACFQGIGRLRECDRGIILATAAAAVAVLVGRFFDNILYMTSLQVHLGALIGVATGLIMRGTRAVSAATPALPEDRMMRGAPVASRLRGSGLKPAGRSHLTREAD